MQKKYNVLMLGPARTVKGGMASVVNNYFEYGLNNLVNLKYIETTNDRNKFLKILKMISSFIYFLFYFKKYDIVHIHLASRISTFRKGIYAKIAKKHNKKVILHIHGGEYKLFLNECNEKQKNKVIKILNYADTLIVLSEEWKKFFSDYVDKSKIKVVYNSVFIPKEFEKDIRNKKILFLGKIVKEKGIFDLINVMEKLIKEYPNLELNIGGDGEIEKIKKILKIKNIEKNVHLLGWIDGTEKIKYLKDSLIFVLPSYNEGMPMSVLEAMAYKNISISTDVGGIPEIINNMKNGIMIKPGQQKELYDSIKFLLENENECKIMIDNSRKTLIEKFDINKNIKEVMKIYEGKN